MASFAQSIDPLAYCDGGALSIGLFESAAEASRSVNESIHQLGGMKVASIQVMMKWGMYSDFVIADFCMMDVKYTYNFLLSVRVL